MKPLIFSPEVQGHKKALSQIGLKPEWAKKIAQNILIAFNQRTPNDAANAAGTMAYFAAVRTIRDILHPEGWKILRQHNLEITKNEDLGLSLSVSSGDKNTGNKDKIPKTKNPKGEQTKKIVYQNAMDPILFPGFDDKQTSEIKSQPNWVLLFHVDTNMKQVRLEISLPIEMDFYGTRIEAWKKRIILPPLDFKPVPVISEPEFAENFEFEIKRKTNDK